MLDGSTRFGNGAGPLCRARLPASRRRPVSRGRAASRRRPVSRGRAGSGPECRGGRKGKPPGRRAWPPDYLMTSKSASTAPPGPSPPFFSPPFAAPAPAAASASGGVVLR